MFSSPVVSAHHLLTLELLKNKLHLSVDLKQLFVERQNPVKKLYFIKQCIQNLKNLFTQKVFFYVCSVCSE